MTRNWRVYGIAAAVVVASVTPTISGYSLSTPSHGLGTQDAPAAEVPIPTDDVVADETEEDENSPPVGGDENVTVTLREMDLGPILPDDVISRFDVDIKKVDPDQPVRAAEGYELFWVYLTIDRIEGVSIQSIPQIQLVDSAGNSHPPNQLQWKGLEFLDRSDITAGFKLSVGGSGFAWFGIPEGATPARLSFTYDFPATLKESDKPAKRKRKRERPKNQSRSFDIVLP